MEGEDRVDEGEDTGQFDAEFLVLSGDDVLDTALDVVPEVAIGGTGVDFDAAGNDAGEGFAVHIEIFEQLLFEGEACGGTAGCRRRGGAGGGLGGSHVLIIYIVNPANFVVGHGDGPDAGDVVVFFVFVVEFHHADFGLVVVFDDVDGGEFLHVILVLVHVGVVQTKENADVLEVDVGAVVDGHFDFVVLIGEGPVHSGFDGHVDEGLLEEYLLKTAVHVFFAILHIAEQAIIDALVAPTEEVVENFSLALVGVSQLGVVFGFEQVGTEDAEAFHRGAIKTEQVLAFGGMVEVGACLVTVEQVGQIGCLTGVLHGCLVEIGDGFGVLVLGTIEEAFEH